MNEAKRNMNLQEFLEYLNTIAIRNVDHIADEIEAHMHDPSSREQVDLMLEACRYRSARERFCSRLEEVGIDPYAIDIRDAI